MEITMEPNVSSHAKLRIQQRGIKKEVFNMVLEEGDLQKNCGGGRISVQFSRKKLQRMIREGSISPKMAERVNGVVIIDAGEAVVTVFHKKTTLRTYH